jgi:hypothetical protein
MQELIDVMNTSETTDTESLAPEYVVTDFPPETTDSENDLSESITSLWVAHANAKIASRLTNAELRVLRTRLGEQLHEMKKMLVRPGRDGQWSAFLREHQIPRATADRLVARHLRTLNPDANLLNEPISEPTEEDVQKLFASVWPKLRRTLRSRQSFQLFMALLTYEIESSEIGSREILVIAAPATTICPVSSDGDSFVEPEVCGATLVAVADEQAI